jgi:hypothetical protein
MNWLTDRRFDQRFPCVTVSVDSGIKDIYEIKRTKNFLIQIVFFYDKKPEGMTSLKLKVVLL